MSEEQLSSEKGSSLQEIMLISRLLYVWVTLTKDALSLSSTMLLLRLYLCAE